MPDSTSSLFTHVYDVAKYTVVAALGFLTFWFKRITNRVDKLSDESVTEDTFNGSLRELRESMDKGFDRVSDDVKGIHQRIDRILEKKWHDSPKDHSKD